MPEAYEYVGPIEPNNDNHDCWYNSDRVFDTNDIENSLLFTLETKRYQGYPM